MDKYNLYSGDEDKEGCWIGDSDMADRLCLALGFCCCGSPDKIADDVAAYLKTVGQLLDDRYYWAAMAADKLELTEHGGSVYGAWLTPYGEAWLKKYEEWSSDKA